MHPVVAVLSFHKIGPPPEDGWDTWFYVPRGIFAGQLAYLRDTGWVALDVSSFVAGLADPAILPERSVVLTFDDGYRSFLDVALPELERFGYPAVLFVSSDLVGGTNAFDAESEPLEALCDWDDLRLLERSRVSVESHGASHRRFGDLDAGAVYEELSRSKNTLEAELAKRVRLLAFPYGDRGRSSDVTESALETLGYAAAFGYGGGAWRSLPENRFAIPRIPVGSDTSLADCLDFRAL